MRTTTIFAETHTSERANHVAYRLVTVLVILVCQYICVYVFTCFFNVFLHCYSHWTFNVLCAFVTFHNKVLSLSFECRSSSYVWFVQIWACYALAEWSTLAPCSRMYNLQVVLSGIQLSSWHGTAVFTRNHSACCWSNIAPSTAICIVIRSCGASNTSFVTGRPSFCSCWTTCMEQSTWVRHWLLVTSHLQEISQDLLI